MHTNSVDALIFLAYVPLFYPNPPRDNQFSSLNTLTNVIVPATISAVQVCLSLLDMVQACSLSSFRVSQYRRSTKN